MGKGDIESLRLALMPQQNSISLFKRGLEAASSSSASSSVSAGVSLSTPSSALSVKSACMELSSYSPRQIRHLFSGIFFMLSIGKIAYLRILLLLLACFYATISDEFLFTIHDSFWSISCNRFKLMLAQFARVGSTNPLNGWQAAKSRNVFCFI